MAGRLQAAVSMSVDRTGRAFIKPFYAQANQPLKRVSPRLVHAADWWIKYLTLRSLSSLSLAGDRPTVHMWTDAAGRSRIIAAVLMCWIDGARSYFWTSMEVPQLIWDQLLDRGDEQIGYQEFLAVVLGYCSFGLRQTLAIGFIDNDGVLASLVKGSARPPEVNTGIGHLWLDFAADGVSFIGARVESKANIADEPSRSRHGTLASLGAVFVPPRLPAWAWQLWQWPV